MSEPTLTPTKHPRSAVETALKLYARKMQRVCLDNIYYCLSSEEWDALIKAVGSEHNKYAAERFDCDAFSRVWYGKVAERYEINGMGIVVDYAGQHSYNALLVDDGDGALSVRLFEPQTLATPKRGVKPYLLGSGILFF